MATTTSNKVLSALGFALLTVVLVACVGSEVSQVPTVPTESPSIMAPIATSVIPTPEVVFAQLTQARSIKIEDEWIGLSHIAPIEAHYDLRRQNGAFSGKANFSVAYYYREKHTAVENIVIPEDMALSFLRTLAQSPTEYGYYEPRIEHTDDYPSISIQIELEGESLKFYTESQGEDHVPWALDWKGSTFVINSDQPAKALALLEPYLKKDTLEKLIKNMRTGMPDTGKQDPQP